MYQTTSDHVIYIQQKSKHSFWKQPPSESHTHEDFLEGFQYICSTSDSSDCCWVGHIGFNPKTK